MTHKEQILQELDSLYDPSFKIPAGLYIPLGQRVLVKECSQEEHKTQAGIIMKASSYLQDAKIGIVYRIGESVTLPIKPGFKVFYEKTAINSITHQSVTYMDLMEHQIYGVVPPENYLTPYVPTSEQVRRQGRIDATKRISDNTANKIDEIQNG